MRGRGCRGRRREGLCRLGPENFVSSHALIAFRKSAYDRVASCRDGVKATGRETHIENGANGTADANELDMARLEGAMGRVELGVARQRDPGAAMGQGGPAVVVLVGVPLGAVVRRRRRPRSRSGVDARRAHRGADEARQRGRRGEGQRLGGSGGGGGGGGVTAAEERNAERDGDPSKARMPWPAPRRNGEAGRKQARERVGAQNSTPSPCSGANPRNGNVLLHVSLEAVEAPRNACMHARSGSGICSATVHWAAPSEGVKTGRWG